MGMRTWLSGLVGGAALLVAPAVMAEPEFDWAAYLKADRVVVAEGRLTYRATQRCKVSPPGKTAKTVYIEWSAETTPAFMSRDSFAAMNAGLEARVIVGFAKRSGGTIATIEEVIDCVPAASASGEVDHTFRVVYEPEGMQLATTDTATGASERNIVPWEKVFTRLEKNEASGGVDFYEDATLLLEEMANIAASTADNCDEMGARLSRFADDNTARFRRLREAGKQIKDKEAERKAMAQYQGRVEAAMGKMSPAQKGCADNPRVQAARKKLNAPDAEGN